MARSGKNYEKSIQAFLGEGTEFKGVISFEGTVRVDGVFEGEVITDGTFIVGQAAKVNANIKAGVVIVMGTLDGRVEAKEKCEIRVGSTMKGEIYTPNIYIEEGAVFEGACHMMGEEKATEGELAPAAGYAKGS